MLVKVKHIEEMFQELVSGIFHEHLLVPLTHSIRTGKVCQFPVKVGGKVHWDCVDRGGTSVCNTRYIFPIVCVVFMFPKLVQKAQF